MGISKHLRHSTTLVIIFSLLTNMVPAWGDNGRFGTKDDDNFGVQRRRKEAKEYYGDGTPKSLVNRTSDLFKSTIFGFGDTIKNAGYRYPSLLIVIPGAAAIWLTRYFNRKRTIRKELALLKGVPDINLTPYLKATNDCDAIAEELRPLANGMHADDYKQLMAVMDPKFVESIEQELKAAGIEPPQLRVSDIAKVVAKLEVPSNSAVSLGEELKLLKASVEELPEDAKYYQFQQLMANEHFSDELRALVESRLRAAKIPLPAAKLEDALPILARLLEAEKVRFAAALEIKSNLAALHKIEVAEIPTMLADPETLMAKAWGLASEIVDKAKLNAELERYFKALIPTTAKAIKWEGLPGKWPKVGWTGEWPLIFLGSPTFEAGANYGKLFRRVCRASWPYIILSAVVGTAVLWYQSTAKGEILKAAAQDTDEIANQYQVIARLQEWVANRDAFKALVQYEWAKWHRAHGYEFKYDCPVAPNGEDQGIVHSATDAGFAENPIDLKSGHKDDDFNVEWFRSFWKSVFSQAVAHNPNGDIAQIKPIDLLGTNQDGMGGYIDELANYSVTAFPEMARITAQVFKLNYAVKDFTPERQQQLLKRVGDPDIRAFLQAQFSSADFLKRLEKEKKRMEGKDKLGQEISIDQAMQAQPAPAAAPQHAPTAPAPTPPPAPATKPATKQPAPQPAPAPTTPAPPAKK